MRASSGMGAVRLGVEGSRSPINSSTARIEKITTAIVDPMKANGELLRFIQPRCAAHATNAGGVNARKPVVKPMAKANTNTVVIENRLTEMVRRGKRKAERKRGSDQHN